MKNKVIMIKQIVCNLQKLDEHFLRCVLAYTKRLAE